MSGDESVELYGYSRGRQETEELVSQLDKAGISETVIRVPGKEGWHRVAKTGKRKSVWKSLMTGLPVGAIVGGLIVVSTQTEQAGASRFHINLFFIAGLILVSGFLWGGLAALANLSVGRIAPSPGNGRYLITVRCRPEDKLKIQQMLVHQGVILTDKGATD